jgi:hypothetical protein
LDPLHAGRCSPPPLAPSATTRGAAVVGAIEIAAMVCS